MRPRDAAGRAVRLSECFGPLEVAYDFGPVTREQIEAGPQNIWRYRHLLPVPDRRRTTTPTPSPGCTPLIRADRLAAELGIRALWVKDDSANPTHSFKDRVVSVALTAARELGFTGASPAPPPATWPTRWPPPRPAPAGTRWCSSRPTWSRPRCSRPRSTAATLVAVDGSYDDVNRLCTELAETDEFEDTAFVNVNVRPFYAEGSKTLGYEVAEQLGWRLPGPGGHPDGLRGAADQGGQGVHASWSSSAWSRPTPLAGLRRAVDRLQPDRGGVRTTGRRRITPVQPDRHRQVANIGDPAAGPYALDAVRRTGGWMDARPTTTRSATAIRLLARTDGVFAETAGGVTVRAPQAGGQGRLDPDAETVVFNTGDGLKTLDAVAGQVGPTATVPATTKAVREALAARRLSGLPRLSAQRVALSCG